jgi:hypothetical protein
MLATAAAVAAVAVALTWYFSRRTVEVTVVLEFERSGKNIRKARVELERNEKTEAEIEVKVVDRIPKRKVQKFKLRKGKYTLRTAIEYTDGSRRRSSRKVKVESQARWVITIR